MNRFYGGKARLRRGSATPEKKSGRIALLSASLLTLLTIGCGSLGLWRICTDLEWAGDFVIQDGFLSHWQVWMGAAIGTYYTSWRLACYAGLERRREVEIASGG